jgi:hypothetical protein
MIRGTKTMANTPLWKSMLNFNESKPPINKMMKKI